MPSRINHILLIDDHALVRTGLSLLLQKIDHVEVVGEAETGWQGIRLARELKPDLIILDFKLPDISGLEVIHRLLKIDAFFKILILTSETHELAPEWLISAGAHGYLVKSASQIELQQALEKILNGSKLPNPESIVPTSKTSLFKDLSTREIEIIRMMIHGYTANAIGQQLCIETKTVYAYRSDIFKKLQIKNVVTLALLTLQQGLISVEEL